MLIAPQELDEIMIGAMPQKQQQAFERFSDLLNDYAIYHHLSRQQLDGIAEEIFSIEPPPAGVAANDEPESYHMILLKERLNKNGLVAEALANVFPLHEQVARLAAGIVDAKSGRNVELDQPPSGVKSITKARRKIIELQEAGKNLGMTPEVASEYARTVYREISGLLNKRMGLKSEYARSEGF
jgi:hypothetical protein